MPSTQGTLPLHAALMQALWLDPMSFKTMIQTAKTPELPLGTCKSSQLALDHRSKSHKLRITGTVHLRRSTVPHEAQVHSQAPVLSAALQAHEYPV